MRSNAPHAAYRLNAERSARPALRLLVTAFLGFIAATTAVAKPHVPADAAEVVERLPFAPRDAAMSRLRDLRMNLARDPENLRLALRVARTWSELGRVSGDPRYVGYAQAALRPWWDLPRPPDDVMMIRATLNQRIHRFDAALADLDALIVANPRHAQARLTRATVLQVEGRFEPARRECEALSGLAPDLLAQACIAGVDGATGRLREGYRRLSTALDRHSADPAELRAWAMIGLGEMAAKAGMDAEAEGWFKRALAFDASDFYLLGAYADLLLDQQRWRETAALLERETRSDPLLLRYTIALKRLGSAEYPKWRDQLGARIEASRRRGDRIHLREEARFELDIADDPRAALALARENWRVQKEAADARVLIEAAAGSHDAVALREARAWLASTRFEDVRCVRALHATPSMKTL